MQQRRFGLADLMPLDERAHEAHRMFERTIDDFNREWAYARAHPECPFEGDRIDFYRGLTAELDSGSKPLADTSHQLVMTTCYAQPHARSPSRIHGRPSA